MRDVYIPKINIPNEGPGGTSRASKGLTWRRLRGSGQGAGPGCPLVVRHGAKGK